MSKASKKFCGVLHWQQHISEIVSLLFRVKDRNDPWLRRDQHRDRPPSHPGQTVTHVIIFLSYTTTPGIIEAACIPITPIYIYILQYNTERGFPNLMLINWLPVIKKKSKKNSTKNSKKKII